MFFKLRKSFEDTLYVLGVKDCDAYLPSDQEVLEMIQQSQKASANKQPSPDDQAKMAKAKLDSAKADEINAEVAGNTASSQLEGYALLEEHKAKAYGQ